MKYVTHILLSISILLGLSFHCHSQTANEQEVVPDEDKKNSLHITGTVRFQYGVSATGSYERVLFKDSLSRHSLFVKGELGVVGSVSGEQGSIIGTQVGYLYRPPSKDKEYFEISIGFYRLKSFARRNDGEISISPTGLIGYRSRNPDGWFIFRYGFSYPLGVYFGVGAAF